MESFDPVSKDSTVAHLNERALTKLTHKTGTLFKIQLSVNCNAKELLRSFQIIFMGSFKNVSLMPFVNLFLHYKSQNQSKKLIVKNISHWKMLNDTGPKFEPWGTRYLIRIQKL